MSVQQNRSVILLTNEQEKPHFEIFLRRQNPALEVVFCDTLESLSSEVDRRSGHVRLIAFLTDLIVPKPILEQLWQWGDRGAWRLTKQLATDGSVVFWQQC